VTARRSGLPRQKVIIAEIAAEVHSGEYDIGEPSDGCYSEFVKPSSRGCAAIDVEVAGWLSDRPRGPLLFDTDQSWAIHAEPGGYSIVFRLAGSGAEYLQARADDLTTRVSVFVDAKPYAAGAAPRTLDPGSRVVLPTPYCYPLDQILLMHHLAERGSVIVHAAGVVAADGCLLVCGASGAGKTTLAREFMAAGAPGAILSDDRIIVREIGAVGFVAWGTPWPGEAGIARNECAPLDALLFLSREDEPGVSPGATSLSPLDVDGALRRLLPVVSCPWYDERRATAVLSTCERLVTGLPSYELRFRPGGDVVACLSEFAASLPEPGAPRPEGPASHV